MKYESAIPDEDRIAIEKAGTTINGFIAIHSTMKNAIPVIAHLRSVMKRSEFEQLETEAMPGMMAAADIKRVLKDWLIRCGLVAHYASVDITDDEFDSLRVSDLVANASFRDSKEMVLKSLEAYYGALSRHRRCQ